MKTLKELYKRLHQDAPFHRKYPELRTNDGKIHVLFLTACLNEQGYYRVILPALELNRTDTHSAIVASLHKWNFGKLIDDYQTDVDYRLVKWADYLVLPTWFTNMDYILKNMREVNPDLEFVMDIDCNYHQLPEYHPDYQKVLARRDDLLENIRKVDVLTTSNLRILKFYHELLDQSKAEYLVDFERYHSLLSNYTYEEVPAFARNFGSKVRIGLVLDPSMAEDTRAIEQALRALLEKSGEQVELFVLGWTAQTAEKFGLFQGLSINYYNPVGFEDYHAKLNSFALDIGLLPYVNNEYNATGRTFTRYLDFAAMMVPVVASKLPVYEKLVQDGVDGYLAANEEEWLSKISALVSDAGQRKNMGNLAWKMAWEKYSYTPLNMQRLKSVFS